VRTALEAAQGLLEAGFRLTALDAGGSCDLWDIETDERTAFVLGGEHGGVADEVIALVSQTVRIPMAEGVESLNVSAAAAILFFELRRRAQLAATD
jgi:23S rRNA (guanosine2251-2'-O)-methyltransferase